MEKINQKRNVEIDMLKGLAIILMVVGHTETPVQNFIYLFHMAVFFMASGYLYKESVSDSSESMKKYILRKMKGLWMPYALWTAIFSLLRNVFIDLNIYTANPNIMTAVESQYAAVTPYWTWREILLNIIKGCILPGNVQVGGALWFLATLLHITILYGLIDYLLKRVLKKEYVLAAQGVVSILFLLIGYYCSLKGIFLFGFVRAFSFYCLFYLGFLLKKYKGKLLDYNKTKSILIAAGSFSLLIVYNFFGGIALGENEFVNPIFMLTASLAGWLLLYEGAVLLKNIYFVQRILSYLGANTLSIVILHLLAFKIVSYIGVCIYHQESYLVAAFPVLYKGGFWWILYTIAGIMVPLFFNLIWKKITGIFMEKKYGYN